MKILLAYLCNRVDADDYWLSLAPVGLVSLAACLEGAGHDVTLANFSKRGYRAGAREAAAIAPEAVGVSIFTHNRAEALAFVREVKKLLPAATVIVGGPHASFLAGEILRRVPAVDYVVTGEAEHAVIDLINTLKKGTVPPARIIPGGRIAHIDTLPAPGLFGGRLLYVDPNEQFKYLVTSRGCAHACVFCSSPGFWLRTTSFRSARDIVDEMRRLHDAYGIIYFSIRDDNFTQKKGRVMEFARLLGSSGMYVMWNCQARVDAVDREMLVAMKRAGLEHIQYGVESGSPAVLARYDKKTSAEAIVRTAEATRAAGIYLSIYLMAGMAGETHADIRKTVALIRKILPGDGIVSPVALYPGTALYEDEKRAGRIHDADWFSRKDAGIFLRNEPVVAEWMNELLHAIAQVRGRAWYAEADFRRHRELCGTDCWVTDILEGDYWLDEERTAKARAAYRRVTESRPRNPWGHFRLGKLSFRDEDFAGAAECYREVTRIVPAFYGGWLKLAEAQLALGNRRDARESAREAQRRNAYDERIRNVLSLLK
ncbi:MAG TPA: cobalamin-dependent protein [Spirochaetota bacterium]|nr:cobalamin-dependent protein [Spirochaetota bacterium]HNT12418.1 cobalamin-dependent protein [Spirochaetota bacterium]